MRRSYFRGPFLIVSWRAKPMSPVCCNQRGKQEGMLPWSSARHHENEKKRATDELRLSVLRRRFISHFCHLPRIAFNLGQQTRSEIPICQSL